MATKKTPVRTFDGDWAGLDKTRSVLTKDANSAVELKNWERLANGSLRARPGLKVHAQPLYMYGIHNYQYIDSDGNPQEELIGIGLSEPAVFDKSDTEQRDCNGHLFRLKTGTFSVTYSGGGSTWGMSITPESLVNGSQFVLSVDASSQSTANLGHGNGSLYTIKQLADQINAVSDFSCSPPKTAIVNGNQSSTTVITVDSGHTLSDGDFVQVPSTVTATNGSGEYWIEVLAQNATEIYPFRVTIQSISDDVVIGHGNYPAVILDWQELSESSDATQTLTYHYWEPVPGAYWGRTAYGIFLGKYLFPFEQLADDFGKQENRLPTFTNHNNSCYISAAYADASDCTKIVNSTDDKYLREPFKAGTWKYDGVNFYLSGPIQYGDVDAFFRELGLAFDISSLFSTSQSSSGTALPAGDYKYQVSFLKTDANNLEIESFLEYQVTHTQSGTKNVDLSFRNFVANTLDLTLNQDKYDIRFTQANGTESTDTTSFTVDSPNPFRVGDYVYFLDVNSEVQKRRVTAWDSTTITLDTASTISNNNYISNCVIRIWRTKLAGNEFFLATQTPYYISTVTTTLDLVDSTTDANLGINISTVKSDNIQFSFPAVNALESHQDLLVCGGGPSFRQEIAWEDPLNPESIDLARNTSPVPGNQSGGINTLRSHTESSLMVAKCGAVYEAVGSFAANEVEVTKVIENSYGSKATDALTPIDNLLIGGCEIGLFTVDEGRNISTQIGLALLSRFRQKDNSGLASAFEPRRFIFHYDTAKQWVHIFLPRETGYSVSNFSGTKYIATTDSEYYILQLPNMPEQAALWSEVEFQYNMYPNGGMASYNSSFYTQTNIRNSDYSWTGYLWKRLDDETNLTDNCFIDDGHSYDVSIIPQWDDGDEPEYDKFWDEFVLYQLQPDYFVAAFTLAFESYREWVTDGTKTDTSRASSLVFSASSDKEKTLQFDKKYKAKRRTFKLSATVYKNPPLISGYAFTVDDRVYRKDKFGRQT